MSSKRSVETLLEQAKQAEARARKLRAEAKKMSDREAAQVRVDVVRAVDELRLTLPSGEKPMEEMPRILRSWAETNRRKAAAQSNERSEAQ